MADVKKAPVKKTSTKDSVDFPKSIFDVKASPLLLAQYVRVYLANQRQGTHKTKGRGEVAASTRKIYRQKGTGRARHGAPTANLFVGGGVTFGPQVRSHNLKMNKKQKQIALYAALTNKRTTKKLHVTDLNLTEKSTLKEALKTLEKEVENIKKTLVVYATTEAANMKRVFGNVQNLDTANAKQINAYNVLKNDVVVFTKEALKEIIEFRNA